MRKWFLIGGLAVAASVSFAADRATLRGKVTGSNGKPLEGATVMIFRAGVKRGYSTSCPTCYVDCGKRAVTDRAGDFSIKNLDPDLWFDILAVRNGYTPTFVRKVDPSQGPAATAALAPRAAVHDPDRVVHGRVVDSHGRPQRAAVVVPVGVATMGRRGPVSQYFIVEGLEPVAATNAQGEFELAYFKKATGMLLRVEARGMAAKVVAVATGAERHTITVSDGVVIRGRLVNQGKGVAGAEIGLIPRNRGGFGMNLTIIGDPYDEIRIGTQEDGLFVITNVPAPVDWYVYGKMESIAALGATAPVHCATTRDNEEVNVGDIEIRPGHRLRGKITLSDGAAMAEGMRITISPEGGCDSQTVIIRRDGRFEFAGLSSGKYEILPSVRGYALPGNQDTIEMTIDQDMDDFAIALEPVPRR
ncbi:MAG: carboxypeptidase-like regulatory domain-containing protein [Bryobacteraceae bacterium]